MRAVYVTGGRRRRRRWPWVVGGLLLLLAGGALAAYLTLGEEPGDVSNPDVEFTDEQPPPEKRKRSNFRWPVYGYDAARTRYLDADIGPPLKAKWKFRAHSLLEFQPVLAKETLFLVRNDGQAVALSARTGKVKWRRSVGSLSAASPAYARNRIYTVALSGKVNALRAKDGKRIWTKDLPSRAESSPLVMKGRVYFGSEDGTVYCLRARDGKTIWTYGASGAVKAGLAYSRGLLFFGDYAGEVTAIRRSNGKQVWSVDSEGRSFNRSGNFYSTPAVAFGRVYLGNTDGFVYSYAARSGRLAWRTSTGGYVYAAPAVARVPGTKPSVYIGSYDGNFYSLHARSGSKIWSHNAGGRISGAATVIGRNVYFSNLGAKNTVGLDARSGRRVWSHHNGAFNPVISDGERIYLTGNASQYAFVPKRKARKGGRDRRGKGERKRARGRR
jgi:outer membrane protein assembly factor BamB